MKKLIIILGISLLLWGCGKTETSTVDVESKAVHAKVPDNLFGELDKSSAIPVLEARKLKEGDELTVHGKVMGAKKVFVDNRATFIIGDPSTLESCDLIEGDTCKYPWDVCCEDPKERVAGTLSVQVVDENGKVLDGGLKGINGLKELSKVVIKGKVAQASENNMVITAQVISIEK